MLNNMTLPFPASIADCTANRAVLISEISKRIAWEHEHGDEKTVQTFQEHRKRAERLDNFTLAYAASVGFPWHALNTQKNVSACFNEKALPKIWEAMRALNGSNWQLATIEGFTLCSVVTSLRAGRTFNTDMQRDMFDASYSAGRGRGGRGFTAGTLSTQVSSSCRALEALGIITPAGSRAWHIASADLLARLPGGALHGMPCDADDTGNADDTGSAAETDDTAETGIVIDGEYVDLTTIALLPAPDAASADDMADDAEEAPQSDADGMAALPATPAMLALPTPQEAPAKPRKGRKGKGKEASAS